MATLEELQAQLQTVTTAIAQTIAGTRLTQLDVGSGEFRRRYSYAECSLENLSAERVRLERLIEALTPAAEPVYRSGPLLMTWSKT